MVNRALKSWASLKRLFNSALCIKFLAQNRFRVWWMCLYLIYYFDLWMLLKCSVTAVYLAASFDLSSVVFFYHSVVRSKTLLDAFITSNVNTSLLSNIQMLRLSAVIKLKEERGVGVPPSRISVFPQKEMYWLDWTRNFFLWSAPKVETKTTQFWRGDPILFMSVLFCPETVSSRDVSGFGLKVLNH